MIYSICSKGKKIYYSTSKSRLDKDDFKVKRKTEYAASTTSAINIEIHWEDFKYYSKADAVFIQSKSYIRKSVLQSPKLEALLNHETGHFRITALFAFMFQEKSDSLCVEINENSERDDLLVIKELTKLYNEVEKERRRMQRLYDKETSHGTKSTEQELWDEKILGMLTKYN